MKLKKVSALAEIVSSIAIVGTLAYLAVQSQQTNRALFSNSRAQIMSADLQLVLEVASNTAGEGSRGLVDLALPGLEIPDSQVEEVWREMNLLAGMVRVREFAWFQYRDGLLDERAWEGYAATLVRNLQVGYRPAALWEFFKPELDPDFAAEIDARIATN